MLVGLEAFGKLIWLAKGELPPRTKVAEAIDVVIGVVLLIWATVLLVA